MDINKTLLGNWDSIEAVYGKFDIFQGKYYVAYGGYYVYMAEQGNDWYYRIHFFEGDVTETDVYNPHILAEIVFASDQGYGNIEETNRMIMRKNYLMRCKIMNKWELMEWDDSCISLYKMDELAAEAGKQTWYYVSYNMLVSTLIMLRILEIILIFVAVRFDSGIKKGNMLH